MPERMPDAVELPRDVTPSMLFLNPPDHTRIRGLVSRAFTPRRVEALRPRVEAMTDALLDDLAEAGGGDLVETLAFPLPANVISELVGVPVDDRDWLRPRVADLAATLEPSTDEAMAAAALKSGDEVRAYLRELVEKRRAEPADDLLSALIAASDGEDRLTEDEVISNTTLIYAAASRPPPTSSATRCSPCCATPTPWPDCGPIGRSFPPPSRRCSASSRPSRLTGGPRSRTSRSAA